MTVSGEPNAGALEELAPAKINLSLRVLGRRPDGYHELESLVAFGHGADDRIALTLGQPLALEIVGDRAEGLPADPSNLVLRAAEAALRAAPSLRLGRFRLDKRLPVAAGVGGGSADAAAALRLIQRANPGAAATVDWQRVAASIGADVPVCLENRASLMSGLGEEVRPLDRLPPVWAVLANPGVPLATRAVFEALAAPPIPPERVVLRESSAPRFADLADLIHALGRWPNDLEPVAIRLCPQVTQVKDALAHLDGALLARMSGSGPTGFALFATQERAEAGAARLRRSESGWWVEAVTLA